MTSDHLAEVRRRDHRMLATFVITITIFCLLAWRSEVNRDAIERNGARIAAASWLLCTQEAVNIGQINTTRQSLVDALNAMTPQIPVVTQLAAIYESSLLIVPDCGPKP